MMPRPGVDFPIDVALVDSDRQAIANGITTVFHATTWSWEPGLRSADNARRLLEAIETLRPRLAADTRFHLRHETYNLDAEDEIGEWLRDGRIDLFAFNDHMESTRRQPRQAAEAQPHGRAHRAVGRGVRRLVERVLSRADDVPGSIARLAKAAREAGVRMLSHDDDSPAMRQAFRAQGVSDRRISDQRGDRARGGRRRRRHRVRRAQCGARRQPYRLDQGVRHDRQGPVLGAGVRLLLSGAAAGRVSPGRRRRAAAGRGLGFDFGGAGARRRPCRSRHARRGTARRHHPGR